MFEILLVSCLGVQPICLVVCGIVIQLQIVLGRHPPGSGESHLRYGFLEASRAQLIQQLDFELPRAYDERFRLGRMRQVLEVQIPIALRNLTLRVLKSMERPVQEPE